MIFVDTNVFLRFILNDHPIFSPKSKKLIEKANKGLVKLWTTEWVIAEVYWVLSYEKVKFTKSSVFEVIWTLLNFKGLEVRNKKIIVEALVISQINNIELDDAINAILARGEKIVDICSYDKHFDRIGWLTRQEP